MNGKEMRDSKNQLKNREDLKVRLHARCVQHIEERLRSATEAIRLATESAQDDTKSSAGDKYETGREMMQQEIDRHRVQLDEAGKLKVLLQTIDPMLSAKVIQPGAAVVTDQGNFYLAVGAGAIEVDDQTFMSISGRSPLAQAMLSLGVGDQFRFRDQQYTIEDVF